mmetsp:Transcript_18716/g.18813  ORF Transcript_18716/g.18813 Transcript_18716/m.18813 type:complete len:437 (+) Transcript_18716:207-1517(+)|eukprot:CAMPEP_0182417546 /NCGR_PEP_ID=MMETSP1167-20130531/2014_1 /TAXON_ID=2988 /ORGANISM="Mallomonas Sp, Strain CCMP3275" /LENGTH=436 /DNA_ID=CAMNT_0024591183 /DNA_START=154 /DNA_END=1464 /DNA_ORIENTATION=+
MSLRKASLLRATSLRKVCDEVDPEMRPSTPSDSDNQFGRAFQILEMRDWLKSILPLDDFCSSRSPIQALDNFSKNFAKRVNLPCVGIIQRIFRYAALNSNTAEIEGRLRNDSLLTMLATVLWIVCTSKFDELLVLVFDLYDQYEEDLLDEFTLTDMLCDIFEDRRAHTKVSTYEKHETTKIAEVVDELARYSEATGLAKNHSNLKKLRENSCSSFAGVSDRVSPLPGSQTGISCHSFINFFKLKSGKLWQLDILQKKLKECSFGIESWRVVGEWAAKQLPGGLHVNGPRLAYLFDTFGSEVANYMEVRSNIGVIQQSQSKDSSRITHMELPIEMEIDDDYNTHSSLEEVVTLKTDSDVVNYNGLVSEDYNNDKKREASSTTVNDNFDSELEYCNAEGLVSSSLPVCQKDKKNNGIVKAFKSIFKTLRSVSDPTSSY